MEGNRSIIYEERRRLYRVQAIGHKRTVILYSVARVLSLLSCIALWWGLWRFSPAVASTLGITSLALFLAFIKGHLSASRKFRVANSLGEIQLHELEVLQWDYSVFPAGEEHLNTRHQYSFDLDIFGKGSIFQYLNRNATLGGAEQLANRLQHPLEDASTIVQEQEAIKELADKLDWRHNFRAEASLFAEEELGRKRISNWLALDETDESRPLIRVLSYLLPLCMIAVFTCYFMDLIPASAVVLCLLVPLGLAGLFIKETARKQELLDKFRRLMEKYAALLPFLEEERWQSTRMQKLRGDVLVDNKAPASMVLTELTKISALFDKRNNAIMGIVLNALFVWDLHCLHRLGAWRQNHHQDVLRWIESIHALDVMCSFANFSFNYPEYCFPKIDQGVVFAAKNLAHPLLTANERVGNDVKISRIPEVMIVTGANMAGKSTFLRAVGVNYVLAMCGAPVCATEFSCGVTSLYSSMRTSDSLQRHESYFHSELLRLQGIIQHLQSGKDTFVILDEILKGTNSKDKETGSKLFVEKLLGQQCAGIIATHDLSLCTLAEKFPKAISNWSFEVSMEGDKLQFDYTLREGVCSTMNATFLMKQMGIA